jgi:hypothetical protein
VKVSVLKRLLPFRDALPSARIGMNTVGNNSIGDS